MINRSIWRKTIIAGRVCLYTPAIILVTFTILIRSGTIDSSRGTADSPMLLFLSYFQPCAFLLMLAGMIAVMVGWTGYRFSRNTYTAQEDDEEEETEDPEESAA